MLTDGGGRGVWIGSTAPLPVVAEHGWHAVGLPLLVTKVDGRSCSEIAGRPALDVFQRALPRRRTRRTS